ncbi:helix-turn-helix domain-containing protein [Oscillatoria sp. FACHB-1406]|uniref:helix-turn-helix domain-containing protein n=1 Tax=Oscillatoria sp. FACHB-1406 TaxID=2692846 RepID=UPI0016826274|nr:helix-turn-helix domain-containing protein [Oscillatoria sp. FACHB-1406]MBD2576712.1 helix-turn-helix domain-containing protein [Oscillatoria sp. FACHB-1406]
MEFAKLESLQQSRLEEIGKYLFQMRQEQRLSLETIAQQTRIQKYQLEAIEQGNLSKLPPPVYVQGFIKLYAGYLGCNGRDLATTFPLEEPTFGDSV